MGDLVAADSVPGVGDQSDGGQALVESTDGSHLDRELPPWVLAFALPELLFQVYWRPIIAQAV